MSTTEQLTKPFKKCKFNREPFATSIINLINNYAPTNLSESMSLVIALDAGWGTGKTTFVNMLTTKINAEFNKEIYVINYNAWENDYHENALDPLLYDLMKNELFSKSQEECRTKELLKTTYKLMCLGAKNYLTNKLGEESMQLMDNITDIAKGINLDTFPQFNHIKEKRALFSSFQDAISDVLQDKKLLIIIDELDRCKPNFAIETLEIIKHLFKIQNVSFLLSVDIEQLRHSVATIYGQNMNSEGYINKFLNHTITLPAPTKDTYIEWLLEEYPLGKNAKINTRFNDDIIDIINSNKNISIRDINIILKNFRTFYLSSNFDVVNCSLYAIPYLIVIIAKYTDLDLYNNLKKANCHKFTHKPNGGNLLDKYRWLELESLHSKVFCDNIKKSECLKEWLHYDTQNVNDLSNNTIYLIPPPLNQSSWNHVSDGVGILNSDIATIKSMHMDSSTYIEYICARVELFA